MRGVALVRLAGLASVLAFACGPGVGRDGGAAARPLKPDFDYCGMATAALTASIRSFKEQPLGLEDACVSLKASKNGKVYVDARFTSRATLEEPPSRGCAIDRYVVRFDWRHFSASPADGVVLLSFTDGAPDGARPYSVTVEESDWP